MIPLFAVAMAAAPAPCGPLDLPTAMALAAVRSDEVVIRRAEAAAAEADRAIARAVGILPNSSVTFVVGPSPEAHGTILQSRNTNRSLLGLAPFERIDIPLVEPRWTWGQLSSAKQAGEAGVRAKELLVEDTVQQVVLRVMQSYWGISLAKRLLVIAADVKNALATADKRIADELTRRSGEVTLEDKYRVAVFRAEVLQRTSEAEKGVYLARVALAAMLGIDEPQLALKEEALPDLQQQLAPSREQAILQAEQSRPDLRALDQAVEAQDALARAGRAAVLPHVFAGGAFSFAYAPNRDRQFTPWRHDDFRQFGGGAVIGLRQNLAIPLLVAQAQKAEAEVAALRRRRGGLARLGTVQTAQTFAGLRAATEKPAAAQ